MQAALNKESSTQYDDISVTAYLVNLESDPVDSSEPPNSGPDPILLAAMLGLLFALLLICAAAAWQLRKRRRMRYAADDTTPKSRLSGELGIMPLATEDSHRPPSGTSSPRRQGTAKDSSDDLSMGITPSSPELQMNEEVRIVRTNTSKNANAEPFAYGVDQEDVDIDWYMSTQVLEVDMESVNIETTS
ncbi:unnamed protein product [Effrenium voratum]|nr:unnamed protein product [Effrenium voratum]